MSELSKFSPQTRVAIYNRVSTEKKVQMEALDVQVAYTRKLVEDNHLTIVDQYIEPETGTEAEHRLEYQRMIRDIKAVSYRSGGCEMFGQTLQRSGGMAQFCETASAKEVSTVFLSG